MHAGLLVARRIRLDHVPVEQWEHFVEWRVAVQIRVVEVGHAAIPEAHVGRHQRQAGITVARHTVSHQIDEGARIQVRVPLQHGNVADIHRRAAFERHRPRQPVDDLVVPLVEHRDPEGAVRQAGEAEGAVRVALGEGDVIPVGIAHAHVALREPERLPRTAAVQVFVGRAAVVQIRDAALDSVGTGDAIAHKRQAVVDDLRIGKADRHVESGRPELLEVGRAADLDERVMRFLAIQRVGLQPFLAARDAVGGRRRHHAVAARHQVGNDRLPHQRRNGLPIRFKLRAGRDHAHDAVFCSRDRACIETGSRVDRAGQRIGQRHVEHVVAHLARGVAGAARVIEQLDLEAAEAGLARATHGIRAAMHVNLTVERRIIFEHKHRDLRRLQRRLLQHDADRLLSGGDRRAAHGMTALAARWCEIRAPRPGRTILRDAELP